jgi:hypothetical protein
MVTACVQPLGPGFRFSGREAEIRVPPASADELHIRVVDRFYNVGDRPLRSLEVRLPEGPNSETQTVRMTAGGKEISPEHNSDMDRRRMRAAIDPEWKQLQPREIVTEWDLKPEPSARGAVATTAAAFYIVDMTALPLWQAPSGVFTKGGPDPADEILTVYAPADFRILAPGMPVRNKNAPAGSQAARSFHINPLEDFPHFVVAGRYNEQIVNTRQGAVSFWTFRPLDAQQAKTAAARLASSARAFTDFFGPASKGNTVIHLVEAAGELPAEFGDGHDPGGASFPNGVLLDSHALAQGLSDEAVLELAEYKLAQTWFGWRVRPLPEAQILMGRGIGLFGVLIAAEARGQDQRGRMIGSLLQRYDEARRIAADRRLILLPPEYTNAERNSTGYKAALFLVALEDLCGHDNLRAAFKTIIKARANDTVGYKELRSAAEFTSQRDLAEMFRLWLFQPGIPEDFRARYTKPSTTN